MEKLIKGFVIISIVIIVFFIYNHEYKDKMFEEMTKFEKKQMLWELKSDANACKALIAKIKAQPEAANIVPKSGTAEEFIADMQKPPQPSPVVSLEDFFVGNKEIGSIGCNLIDHPGIEKFYEVLKEIRNKESVQGVLIEIWEVDSEFGYWPSSEVVYILTSSSKKEVEKWMKPLGPDEIFEGWEGGHTEPPSAAPKLKEGMVVRGAWWD